MVSARLVFALLVVAYAALLVVAWFSLPDRVPMHFGSAGEVDDWASRPVAVLAMAGIGGALATLFAGLAAWAARGIPLALVNLPNKDWWTATPEREARFRSMLCQDLWWLGAAMMAFLLTVPATILVVADEAEPRLGAMFFVSLGLFLAITLGYAIWMSVVRYRPDDEGLSGASA